MPATTLAPMSGFDSPSVSNAALWSGRVLSGLLILFLALDGAIKLVPLEVVTQTSLQLGIPTHLARTLGVLTLAGTLLYAFPRTSVLGAILLTGYFGGAVATHVRLGDGKLLIPAVFGVLVWLGLYLRDARLRSLVPLRRD
jgi:hypothetical protein